MPRTKRPIPRKARTQLIALRDYMLSKQWCRRRLAKIKGQRFPPDKETLLDARESSIIAVCLEGGLTRVLNKPYVGGAAGARLLNDAITNRLGSSCTYMTSWNDSEAVNKRDVIKLIDEAIILAEKECG